MHLYVVCPLKRYTKDLPGSSIGTNPILIHICLSLVWLPRHLVNSATGKISKTFDKSKNERCDWEALHSIKQPADKKCMRIWPLADKLLGFFWGGGLAVTNVSHDLCCLDVKRLCHYCKYNRCILCMKTERKQGGLWKGWYFDTSHKSQTLLSAVQPDWENDLWWLSRSILQARIFSFLLSVF